MRPAFFFDRDGVINRSPGEGYVLRWEDFHLSDGIPETLAFLRGKGFVLVLVTSQQGVGKGLMTQETLDDIHDRMQASLRSHDAEFDAIYSCTCLEADPQCTCRKPSPEMIVHAAKELDLDLSQSWLVGDRDRDIQMAMNAEVPNTIRIRDGQRLVVMANHLLESTTDLLPLLKKVL